MKTLIEREPLLAALKKSGLRDKGKDENQPATSAIQTV